MQVKEDIIAQSQQLKRESSDTTSNQNDVDVVNVNHNIEVQNHNDTTSIHVHEEKERLLAIPNDTRDESDAVDSEFNELMLLVTMLVAMLC